MMENKAAGRDMTSGQVGPKCRVWGGQPQQAICGFAAGKIANLQASVKTLALLAG